MNFQESNRSGNVRALNIPSPAHDNESPAAVRIGSLERE
jgi:hypothetical protein